MKTIIAKSWPLFLGFGLIMIGNGLQGTLLGLRATLEGYGTVAIGFIMSCYYVGYLLGSVSVPKLVANVGHIRVFSALASMASATILLHGVFIDPVFWAVLRVIAGFSYAGLYVVVESWLNDLAQTGNRGRILSIYMLLSHGGLAAGQFLLPAADPAQMELFVATSILLSLALLPIVLIPRPVPEFSTPSRIGLRHLFRISPLGVVAVLTGGVLTSILFAIGPVYAARIGMDAPNISVFMASITIGAILVQWPMGWLSDRFDHRRMIVAVGVTGAAVALCMTVFSPAALFLLILGGMAMPLYGLAITHTNDHLESGQYVSASASMILFNGIGACFGPVIVSVLMGAFGPHAFFPAIAAAFTGLAVFGLYRMGVAPPVPLDRQKPLVPVPPRGTPLSARLFTFRKAPPTE